MAKRGAPKTAEGNDNNDHATNHADQAEESDSVAGEVVGGDWVHGEWGELVVYEYTIQDVGGQVKGQWSLQKLS